MSSKIKSICHMSSQMPFCDASIFLQRPVTIVPRTQAAVHRTVVARIAICHGHSPPPLSNHHYAGNGSQARYHELQRLPCAEARVSAVPNLGTCVESPCCFHRILSQAGSAFGSVNPEHGLVHPSSCGRWICMLESTQQGSRNIFPPQRLMPLVLNPLSYSN